MGRRDVMDYGVPASGTFNGNPVGVAAALATLEELSQPGVYAGWKPWASSWRTASRPWGRSTAAHSTSATWGVFFVLGFGYTQDLGDFRDWLTQADLAAYQRFVAGCEDYGVRFTDRRGRSISTAHTQEDIRRTLAVADQVLGEMEQGGNLT